MAAFGAATVAFSSTCSVLSQARLPASEMHGEWGSQMQGDGRLQLRRPLNVVRVAEAVSRRQVRMMANKNTGGIFAPVVVLARNVLGKKQFNQLRGKGIALHSQVITEFCKSIGADSKQRQGLIRLAKKNGEKLGFLA